MFDHPQGMDTKIAPGLVFYVSWTATFVELTGYKTTSTSAEKSNIVVMQDSYTFVVYVILLPTKYLST